MTAERIKNNNVYFPGLNGVRCLAAFAVVIHHIEQFKSWEKIPSVWEFVFVKQLGNKAVGMFFVLSGFLITYLLLIEKKRNHKIGVFNFYVRRALRIWPLYFTVLIAAYFFLPNWVSIEKFVEPGSFFWNNFILYLVFLPHIAIFIYPPVLGATQFWSIGIEENFYIIWPLFLKIFQSRLFGAMIGVVILKVVLELLLVILIRKNESLDPVLSFWRLFQFELLVIGGLGALVYQFRKKFLRSIYHKNTQLSAFFCLIALLFLNNKIVGISIIEGLAFAIIILNIATNPKSIIKLRGKFFHKVGNFSYGIYLWHVGVISLVGFVLMNVINWRGNILVFNMLIYFLSFTISIGIAALSYRHLELPFLKLKRQFGSINKTINQ